MENKFAERLNSLLSGLSGNAFARKCGIKQTTMSGYLNGLSEPNRENLIKIARACNVTVGWLADGEGEEATGPQATFAHLPNRDANPKFDDYIGKTARVITSKTIYRSALERNIDAFHKAVETEDEMQGVREKLELMQVKHDRDMEELKRLILNQGASQKRDSAANA
ncbi:MAG: helix-turn-helix transcriptional regulator [Desulfurivibrionaceae bacterium]|jgi:transcriptional regulator with XRE-family HTH domain